jgi:hypothetical protein
MTGVIGPALGAALVAAGGTPLAFSLDAASFFISALFVFSILRTGLERRLETSAPPAERRCLSEVLKGGFADLRQGWDAIIAIPWSGSPSSSSVFSTSWKPVRAPSRCRS